MSGGPTTPTWVTPTIHVSSEQLALGDWNNLANDVALTYAKPWMRCVVTNGYQSSTSGAGLGAATFITGGTGSMAVALTQNSPTSGVGSYSVNSSGVFTLPSGLNGVYRVHAQVILTQSTAAVGRLSIGWQSGGGTQYVDVGDWQQAPAGNYTIVKVDSLMPGNSSAYSNCTGFIVYCATGSSNQIGAYDPANSGHTPTSSPPYNYSFVTCEWVGSDGTF